MNGCVSKLKDIDTVTIPEEMLNVTVDEKTVDDRINCLSLRYAKEVPSEKVEMNDTVFCRADKESYPDSRTVILFTGTDIPGAEDASKDVIGKIKGESFETTVLGEKVQLTVEKIIRRIPAEINDELITSIGIDSVSTVSQYREYVKNNALESLLSETVKNVSAYVFGQLMDESEYSYDEVQTEAAIQENMLLYKKDCEDFGMEYDPDEARDAAFYRIKQLWLSKAFCESKGITINVSEAEEEADRMIEMMSLTGEEVPNRDEYVQMIVENEYIGNTFEYIQNMLSQKIGG